MRVGLGVGVQSDGRSRQRPDGDEWYVRLMRVDTSIGLDVGCDGGIDGSGLPIWFWSCGHTDSYSKNDRSGTGYSFCVSVHGLLRRSAIIIWTRFC